MAKQRRGRRPPAAKPAKPAPAAKTRPAKRPAPAPVPAPVPVRPGYTEALSGYERGIALLQKRDYRAAAAEFEAVLRKYPDERELHDRTRLYLRLCERELQGSDDGGPRSAQERLYAATLALNAGAYDRARDELDAVLRTEPDSDHAHYMMAVVRVLRGDRGGGLESLRRAIELNPENRGLAAQDSDLEALRTDSDFRSLLDSPATSARSRRPRRSSAP